MKLYNGDCLEVMKKLPDNSVDSIVTDPPYGLKFMGKKWDYEIPSVEIWQEAIRVLKPGGHLLSFGGSRTYHRMAVAIEDAGFEIRDQIMWVYGVGFPKSHNIYKTFQKNCTCGNMVEYDNERTKQNTECEVRPLSETDVQTTKPHEKKQGEVLQSSLQEYSIPITNKTPRCVLVSEGGEKSIVEGGSNNQESKRQLQGSDLPEMSKGVSGNGEEGRLHNATQDSNGSTPEKASDENGSGASQRPQSEKQPDRKSCTLCDKWGTQKIRRTAEEIYGFGSSLKPAHEPICMARKPLSESTIAENVLRWQTGGLNIDDCRVESSEDMSNIKAFGSMPEKKVEGKGFSRPWMNDKQSIMDKQNAAIDKMKSLGRFPANFIHDGSDEVVGLLGEPARFFYFPKASKKDRNEGLEGFEEIKVSDGREKEADNAFQRGKTLRVNSHPTVKPTSLMQYLVRLVTPVGGTVLDPFMGSGSTGKACALEGFDFVGIELDPEYCKIAGARIEYAVGEAQEP